MEHNGLVAPPGYRTLIVEDNELIGEVLGTVFEEAGFDVQLVMDGERALAMLESESAYDVVVLDVRLPGKSGFEVLEAIKKEAHAKPAVLLITCLDDKASILKGFELGADDYLVKPFKADELLARVRAILRRILPPSRTPMVTHQVGKLEVNYSTHEAREDGQPVQLTPIEFDLLRYLIAHRGEVVSREQLLTDVWDLPATVITRTIDRHISSLRNKIEPDPAEPRHLTTVYGVGYKLQHPSPQQKQPPRRMPIQENPA